MPSPDAYTYATERVTAIYGSSNGGYSQRRVQFEATAPGYREAIHTTRCDAQGFFRFEDVSDGAFYVQTVVTWVVQYSTQGGVLAQRVQVAGGKTVEVVLAPQ